MIKIIIFIGVVIVGVYLSIYIDRQYKCRIRVYQDFSYLLSVYKDDIIFTKNSFYTILDKLNTHINSYTYSLIFDYKDLKIIRYQFKTSDYSSIYEYLDTVGQGDVEFELGRVKYYINTFNNQLIKLEDDYSKNGKLYSKLVLILAVLIAIILL